MSRIEELYEIRAREAGFFSVRDYMKALDEAERERFQWEEENYFASVGEDDEIQEVS